MNKMEELLHKTREYLDYVENHYNNIKKAYVVLEKAIKGKELWFSDPVFTEYMDGRIKTHDMSKLSVEEFVQYRQRFYPTSYEVVMDKEVFKGAWSNHCEVNDHHWQNWTRKYDKLDNESLGAILENVIDWMAMGYEFGDTALEYYEANPQISESIPGWAKETLKKVLEYVEDYQNSLNV